MVGGRGRGRRSDTLTHTLGSAPPHLTWPRGGGGGQPGGGDHCIFPLYGEGKGSVTSLATHADVHLECFLFVLYIFLSSPGHIAPCSLLISSSTPALPALCVPLMAKQSGLRLKYFPIGFHVIPSHTASCIVSLYPRVSLGASSRLSHGHSVTVLFVWITIFSYFLSKSHCFC